MHQVVKTLGGYSCAHRHHRATSHCRFVHGYDRTFTLWIEGTPAADTGWVIDFGTFGDLDRILAQQFDHTLVIGTDDPLVPVFRQLEKAGGCDLRLMENPGMEGAAQWVYEQAQRFVQQATKGNASVTQVEARENNKNAVLFRPNT